MINEIEDETLPIIECFSDKLGVIWLINEESLKNVLTILAIGLRDEIDAFHFVSKPCQFWVEKYELRDIELNSAIPNKYIY